MAGRADIDERLRPLVEGVEEFIAKPFLVKDLVRVVKKVIDRLHLEKLQKRASRPGARWRSHHVDVVVDPVGGDLAEPALRSLRWGGRFVTVGYASGTIPRIPLNLVMLKGIQIVGFQMLAFATNAPDAFRRNEAELMDLLASGRVLPHIGRRFPLDEVVAALQFVGDGRAIGKVVLDVSR